MSVVVLNWNGRLHSETCLRSLVGLDYPRDRLELILCDNGSTDDSVRLLRRQFPGVRFVLNDRNYGFAEGNNRAARVASGDWVAFLNNDTRVPPDWLRALVAPIERRLHLGAVASRILSWDGQRADFVGGTVNFYGYAFQPGFGHPPKTEGAKRLPFPCGGGMLIRRDLFVEIGGFDPDFFMFFEDVDLGWRLSLMGYDIWYAPEATVFHRHHGSSSGIPPHKLQFLYARNALWTIYKCLDEESLARILPGALLLQNERGMLATGVGGSEFELSESAAAAPRQVMHTALAHVRRFGVAATVSRSLRAVRDRAVLRVAPAGYATVPLAALSPISAVSAFGHGLKEVNERRRWIQRRRVRSDGEIFALFSDPFKADSPDPRFTQFMNTLVVELGIDRLFP